MVTLNKSLACAAIGAGMLAVSAGSARAATVCSGRVCWHTHDSYKYGRSRRQLALGARGNRRIEG